MLGITSVLIGSRQDETAGGDDESTYAREPT
jgi:hypothetical protein